MNSTARSGIPGQTEARGHTVVVARRGKPVAVPPPGDPLRRLLSLSAHELQGIMDTFPNIMRQRDQLRQLVLALLESKTTPLEERNGAR